MAVITVGSEAIDRASSLMICGAGTMVTAIDYNNHCNVAGTITEITAWFDMADAGNEVKVGTFYKESVGVFTCRASQSIGEVIAGSAQSYSVSLPVEVGDYIGICGITQHITVVLSQDVTGFDGIYEVRKESIDPNDSATFSFHAGDALSLQGIGATPKPPTPAVTPYVGLPYRVEVRDVDGHLIAIPRAVFSGQLTRSLNMPDGLSFQIAADDPACKYMTPRYELWVRDLSTGEIVSVCKTVMTEASSQ